MQECTGTHVRNNTEGWVQGQLRTIQAPSAWNCVLDGAQSKPECWWWWPPGPTNICNCSSLTGVGEWSAVILAGKTSVPIISLLADQASYLCCSTFNRLILTPDKRITQDQLNEEGLRKGWGTDVGGQEAEGMSLFLSSALSPITNWDWPRVKQEGDIITPSINRLVSAWP